MTPGVELQSAAAGSAFGFHALAPDVHSLETRRRYAASVKRSTAVLVSAPLAAQAAATAVYAWAVRPRLLAWGSTKKNATASGRATR